MHRQLTASLVAVFALSLAACDKGAAPSEGDKKTDDKKAKTDDKTEDKKAETKKAGDAEPAGPEGEAAVTEVHFDISVDKSGAIARTAAVLETTELTSEDAALREHLAGLSHHAENISSDESMCKHIMELRKAAEQPEGTLESCVIHFEHEVAILGPEVFAQMAQCVMAAKSAAEIDACEAAEKEAEQLLHDQKHGDGLSEEVCTNLFNKFEELSMADVGEHAEEIKAALEAVREDSLAACMDQGTQAEVDCAMKAADMDALTECQEFI